MLMMTRDGGSAFTPNMMGFLLSGSNSKILRVTAKFMTDCDAKMPLYGRRLDVVETP